MGTDGDDSTDAKVKDTLLDAATRAELERWFGLPSFQQVAETSPRFDRPEDDPEIVAVRERRAKAVANVDPEMLEAHRRRTTPPDDLIKFAATIDVHVDVDLPVMDRTMVDRLYSPAEPRDVEVAEQLLDDMHEVTPQAILRDLHRSEETFAKTFEIVDLGAEGRIDLAAAIAEAMTRRPLAMPPPGASSLAEGIAALAAARAERGKPWVRVLSSNLPNRRVTE